MEVLVKLKDRCGGNKRMWESREQRFPHQWPVVLGSNRARAMEQRLRCGAGATEL